MTNSAVTLQRERRDTARIVRAKTSLRHRITGSAPLALPFLFLALAGCQASRPPVEQDIGRATGIGDAIVFRHDPEPATGAASGGTLTPEEAVRLTLTRDPRIQAALAQVRTAEADANQARLLPNPILNIDGRVPHEAGFNTAFEATLTGDLVSLLQKPAQIAAADNRLRRSAADALTTALDVMSEVEEAYTAAQAADLEIQSAEARRQNLQELRDIAKKRLDAGEGTKLDLLTLEGQRVEEDLDFADLQQSRQESRLLLARLIGEPRSPADWQLAQWQVPAAGTAAPETAWIDAALRHRPEIQSKLWELKALGDDLAAAEFSPFIGGEIGAHTEHDPEWRTGPTVTLPLPIFDWGQASRPKIVAQRIAARHELAEQQANIIQEVRVALSGYVRARQALADANEKLLPLLKQQLDLSRLSYRGGEADLATLLLAESEVRQTSTRIIDLQSKLTVARVKLQRAAGGAAVAEILESSTQPATTAPAATNPASAPAAGAASRAATGGAP